MSNRARSHTMCRPRFATRCGRRQALAAAIAAAVLSTGAAAHAFWSAPGAGTGGGVVATLEAPGTPTASVAPGSSTVAVSWAPSSTAGTAVVPQGYYVTRTNGATTSYACGTHVTMLTPDTSCSDTAVPDERWTYRVTAAYRSWTAASAASAAVSIETTIPAVAVSTVNGSTVAFPMTTNASVTSIGGTCGPPTGNDTSVTWSFANRSGTTPCSAGTWSSGGFPAISAEGSYTAQASQTNSLGTGTDSRGLTIDTTAPLPTLTTPSSGATTTTATPAFAGAAGTAVGDAPTIAVRIYSGATTAGTLVQTLSASANAGAWSVTPTAPLGDGTYTAQASQPDSAGNTGNTTLTTFTIDTSAPTAAMTFPAANGSYGTGAWNTGCATPGFCGPASDATSGVNSVTLTIKQVATNNSWGGTSFQPGNRTVTATVASGTWSYAFAPSNFPADGQYTVSGTVTDNGGLTFPLAMRAFAVDRIAPTVTLAAPANGSAVASATPALSGAAGTASGDSSTITVRIYSGSSTAGTLVQTLTATASAGAWSVTAASLGDATYTAAASQTDAAGNTATSSARTFIVDTTAPAVTVTSPANGAAVNASTPTVSGAAGSAGGDSTTVTVAIYAGTTATGPPVQTLTATRSGASWAATPAALAEGTYTARATQTDAAGNTGVSTATTFTVDTTAPSVSLTMASCLVTGGGGNRTVSPTGGAGTATDDGTTVVVTIYNGAGTDGAVFQTITVTASAGAWSTTSNRLSSGSVYTIRAAQTDRAGNTGVSGTCTVIA